MMVTTPLQLVHFNFTSFKTTTNLHESPKIENALVIVDHFTGYTRAYVTKDQKASTAARILYEGFILISGAPKKILMDQGKTFTGEVVEQLCSQFGIIQSTMTTHHPQGNGQVERVHQTLGRMIGKLEDEFKGHMLSLFEPPSSIDGSQCLNDTGHKFAKLQDLNVLGINIQQSRARSSISGVLALGIS